MGSPDIGKIRFVRTDRMSDKMEEAIKNIAEHFKKKRRYLPKIFSLIMTSKYWRHNRLNRDLDNWEQIMSRIKGSDEVITLIKDVFSLCKNDEDIGDVRGSILEALVIGTHGGELVLTQYNYGWGARVDIREGDSHLSVLYECEMHKNKECGDRSTVDFGYWNGFHARFFECKVQPKLIGCKEIQYMLKLQETMHEKGISHEIFFVCPSSEDDIKIKIDEAGGPVVFKPLGTTYLMGCHMA